MKIKPTIHPNEIVVYTALSNNYDKLLPPLVKTPGVSYICFSDNPDLCVEGWEIHPLPEFLTDPEDHVRRAKMPKVLPHLLLEKFEHSVWVDASMQIKGCMLDFVLQCQQYDKEFVLFEHPDAPRTIYEEGAICIAFKLDNKDTIQRQLAIYNQRGLTESHSIPACTIIYRRHNTHQIKLAMQDWWNEILMHSRRDQLSFVYVMQKHALSYGVIPENYQDHQYFMYDRHEGYGPNAQGVPTREPVFASLDGILSPPVYKLQEDLSDSVTVIVRSVDERTTKACLTRLNKIFGYKNIFHISEKPFSKAVKESFRLGIAQNRKWTLVIDADVLIRTDFPSEIIAYADRLQSDVFVVQALVLDKFLNVFRPAGNHLYRTKFLRHALQMIPSEGSTLRPEYTTIQNMIKAGTTFVQTNYIVGIHDYEQEYADIAHKTFLYAHKHQEALEVIWPYWQDQAQTDPDFHAAIIGVEAGRKYSGKIFVDKRFFADQLAKTWATVDIEPKEPLPPKSYPDESIDRILKESLGNPIQRIMQEMIYPERMWWTFWEPTGPRCRVFDSL
ncbi:glycosyltransferase domain-containing protein [Maridesulfovibrio hydrothermalis]|uniref:TOD1/MUCI70 glycosyltransferase-like domain-containing protein n=1 Tax=Maridesulfovibrio hydrothermalis AM13 = DSM 14728 TaxID=1121451 RepID=L0R8N4_9BACT|nr:glycosyltransferase domain-containing protein [Maridesulfovibrio hydrothermalis]CCO22587.1 protein of unknown function [Maridesulfovibrio hydrothermalis AM13 = DSM 14728]